MGGHRLTAVTRNAAPAQAAKPTFSVKGPAAGDITLAHVVFETKGGKGTPKLVLTNKAKLGSRLTVAGGVVKLKKNRYLASVALLLKTGGGGGTPALKLVPPKGMSFSKFTAQQIAKNLLSTATTPKFCGAVPQAFAYVSKKLLAGSAIPRFPDPRELVRAGYLLDCTGYGEEEANLRAALRGEPDPNSAPPGSGGTGGGEEEGEEGSGIPQSSTMQVKGTVFDEGGGVFRYEISFNEPVNDFNVQVSRASVECPNQYSSACSNTATAGAMTLDCKGGEFTFEFLCGTQRSGSTRGGTAPPTVPAETVIVGRFKINAGSVAPGSVKVSGFGPSGQGQAQALSGP